LADHLAIRPFDWRDIPLLHRSQSESVFLDSALVLTRGALLVPGAVFSYLAPAMGVFTAVSGNSDRENNRLIGQIIHIAGAPFAHMTFLSPASALERALVTGLTEYLATAAGERGALRLLADVEEHTQAFNILRQCGFAIYARQRIWRVHQDHHLKGRTGVWRSARSQDLFAIRALYNNLAPGLVQQVEPYVKQRPHGLVSYEEGELLAYVDYRSGHRGIWVQPFIHPDTKAVPERLAALIQRIPNRMSRPMYLCVPSYQAWLEAAVEALGADPGPKQAVMVKQMAIQQKAGRTFALPALEGGQAEISAPLARLEQE
jgi:hypothetical protein